MWCHDRAALLHSNHPSLPSSLLFSMVFTLLTNCWPIVGDSARMRHVSQNYWICQKFFGSHQCRKWCWKWAGEGKLAWGALAIWTRCVNCIAPLYVHNGQTSCALVLAMHIYKKLVMIIITLEQCIMHANQLKSTLMMNINNNNSTHIQVL